MIKFLYGLIIFKIIHIGIPCQSPLLASCHTHLTSLPYHSCLSNITYLTHPINITHLTLLNKMNAYPDNLPHEWVVERELLVQIKAVIHRVFPPVIKVKKC